MLAIKKRHKAVKAITAGSIAFTLGIAGAAAYIDRSQQHENLTFSTQDTPQSSPASPQANAGDVQGASSGNGTAMPQATGSTQALAPAPTRSQSAAPVASAASAPAPTATVAPPSTTTVTPTPGMGGGSGGGSESPDKEEDPDLIDQVLDVLPSL